MLFARAELTRSKLRFALCTLGAGLLIFVLLFQQALLAAMLDGMAGALKHQSGPIIVFTKEAQRNLGVGPLAPGQAEQVAQLPGVGGVGSLGLGLLSYRTELTGDTRTNVSVIGYQPDKPGTPTALSAGRLPETPDEIVASTEGSAGKFGLNDTLTFEPGGRQLRVVGLTEGALLSIGPALWIPWGTFEQLLKQVSPNLPVWASVLAVEPAPGASTEDVIRVINTVGAFDAMDKDLAAESAPGRVPIQNAFFSVMLLCYVVVGIVIGFFFLTITLQKERSITMLRAVGATAGYLIASLLTEVAVVMTGGLVIGVVVLYLVRVPMKAIILLSVSPAGILWTVAPAVAVALAGTLPPIRRMLRTDPNAVVSKPMLGSVG